MHQPETIIKLAWIAFGIISIITIGFTVIGTTAFLRAKSGTAKSFTFLFERAQAIKIATVVLIIISTVGLSLAGKIDSNGVVGILSGIAGYVLGGLANSSSSPESSVDSDENKQ